MFDFHEKRKIRRVIHSWPFIGAIVLVALVISLSVYERYTMEREMALKLEKRTEQLALLEVRAKLLEEKVSHLRNERGIEEELRTRFDVAKEGEQVVIILDDDTRGTGATSTKDEGQEPNKGFFEMLKFW
jgi:predicted amidophosphoribosyltransferase